MENITCDHLDVTLSSQGIFIHHRKILKPYQPLIWKEAKVYELKNTVKSESENTGRYPYNPPTKYFVDQLNAMIVDKQPSVLCTNRGSGCTWSRSLDVVHCPRSRDASGGLMMTSSPSWQMWQRTARWCPCVASVASGAPCPPSLTSWLGGSEKYCSQLRNMRDSKRGNIGEQKWIGVGKNRKFSLKRCRRASWKGN